MCCGCNCGGCSGCGGIPYCTGNLFVIAERLISYLALTAVICCIVILFAVSMGIGIGLGYNYCVVDMKVQTQTAAPPILRTGADVDEIPEYKGDDTRRSLTSSSAAAAADTVVTKTVLSSTETAVAVERHTLTLPLHASNMDFTSLLAKLRARNKNITLELVT